MASGQPARVMRRLYLASALLLTTCTFTSDDQLAEDPAGPRLDERLAPGEVRAGIITRRSELIDGLTANGRVGDLKLYNSKVGVVIAGGGRGTRLPPVRRRAAGCRARRRPRNRHALRRGDRGARSRGAARRPRRGRQRWASTAMPPASASPASRTSCRCSTHCCRGSSSRRSTTWTGRSTTSSSPTPSGCASSTT